MSPAYLRLADSPEHPGAHTSATSTFGSWLTVADNRSSGYVAFGTLMELNGPAPTNFVVTLESKDEAAATVQGNVTVRQDAMSATFDVITKPVALTRPVRIVASKAGVERIATLRVQQPSIQTFTFSPSTIPPSEPGQGGSSKGTITLNGSAPSGTSVKLEGLDPTIVALSPGVGTEIPFPADKTSVDFQVVAKSFQGSRELEVTASYLGLSKRAEPKLTVGGTKWLKDVSSSFVDEVVGGEEVFVVPGVQLRRPAPTEGITIGLSSSLPDKAKPTSRELRLAAGESEKSFKISTVQVGSPTQVIDITASDRIVQRVVHKLKLIPITTKDLPQLTQLKLDPQTMLGGATWEGIVGLDIPAPAGGITVDLRCEPSNVASPVQTPVRIDSGQREARFTVNTNPVSRETPVTVTASRQNVQKAVTLRVQQPTIKTFTFSPSTIPFDELSRGTIILNGPAPSNTSLSLSAEPSRVEFPDGRTVPVPDEATEVTFKARGRPLGVSPTRVTVTSSYLKGEANTDVTIEGLPT
jgi:hypothetical protein